MGRRTVQVRRIERSIGNRAIPVATIVDARQSSRVRFENLRSHLLGDADRIARNVHPRAS